MSVSGWDGRPVPDLILSIAFAGGAAYNETAWNNEEFDKIMVEARGVTDFDKRKEMYCDLQRMIQDDGGHITMAFSDYMDASPIRGAGHRRPSFGAARLLSDGPHGVDRGRGELSRLPGCTY